MMVCCSRLYIYYICIYIHVEKNIRRADSQQRKIAQYMAFEALAAPQKMRSKTCNWIFVHFFSVHRTPNGGLFVCVIWFSFWALTFLSTQPIGELLSVKSPLFPPFLLISALYYPLYFDMKLLEEKVHSVQAIWKWSWKRKVYSYSHHLMF